MPACRSCPSQYFLKVVPTVYSYLNNQTVSTNQFSVTENFRESQPGPGRSLPGVFFFFDLSPIKARGPFEAMA